MISIIVPIYKVEKYLKQCVDSILRQTYKDLEIILVDDGSPDNCPDMCDEYAMTDNRVKVIHKKNGGLMSARQAGLRAATGEYIGFVDGDDCIKDTMYEKFAEAIEKYHPDMALCEFLYAFPDRNEKSEQNLSQSYYDKKQMEDMIYPTMLFKDRFYCFGINPCCWSKVYKKELLENNLYKVTPKIKIGEDAAFTYPCLLDADSLAYIGDYLYFYRINPQSMTKSYDENLHETILIPYNILKEKFASKSAVIKKQLNYYLLFLINGIVRNTASPQNKKSVKEKLAILKTFTNNDDVVKSVKSVDFSILPVHTKMVARFFSMKSEKLLYLYSIILKRFL